MSRKDHRFTESPVLKDQLASWRIHFVSALIFGALLALVGRAFYLQVIHEDFLQERGDARYRRVLEIPASRGKILDRHGDMLAQSTPMRAVWATADAKLDKEQLKALGDLLEMDPRLIEKKLTGDKNFVYLKHQVSPDAAARIAALKLPGIQMDREYSRFYPAGEMVAHMVGFTGKDDRGQEGVELAFESRLIGANGERTVIKDRRGQIVEEVGSERPPQDGEDIQLAIDSKIQFIAFNALRNAADKFNAKGGSVIVADIKTGEILALANWPTYNPNNRSQLSGGQLRNRAVTDSFEPGSTMKPFVAALALDRGKYKFDSIINCVLGQKLIATSAVVESTGDATPRVSGSLASHYAPLTPLTVLELSEITHPLAAGDCAAIVRDCAELSVGLRQHGHVVILADQPARYAHDFYRVLRELDAKGYRHIYVQNLPDTQAWLAVRDRLSRAAHRESR